MTIICECGKTGPANSVVELWQFLFPPWGHQHIPHREDGTDRYVPTRVTFKCICGQERKSSLEPWHSAAEDTDWLNYHIMQCARRSHVPTEPRPFLVRKTYDTD